MGNKRVRYCDHPELPEYRGQMCDLERIKVEAPEGEDFELFGFRVKHVLLCPYDTTKTCRPRYVDDYGHCVPGCQVCHGLGEVYYDVDTDDKLFGRTKLCPNKAEGWNPGTTGITMAEYKQLTTMLILNSKFAIKMRDIMYKIVNDRHGFVWLWGDYGIGKSMAGKLALILATRKGMRGSYWTHDSMMDYLRGSFSEENGQQLVIDRVKYFSELPVLIWDEVGRGNKTDFSEEKTSRILDQRYHNFTMNMGITVILANSSPEELMQKHIIDRLHDGRCLVEHVIGTSMRPILGMTDKYNANSLLRWLPGDEASE